MLPPDVLFPTCFLGFIKGQIRYETLGGFDMYPGDWGNHFLFFKKPFDAFLPNIATDFAVTHLQKKSKCGFLIMWPFCLHFWWSFKPQQQAPGGSWIPGTEKVLYWRFGKWRWDAGDSKFIGPWTWYGPGLHWD